ncbi:MAG: glutathione S-transferase family protein [Myxococcota bacterium]
MTPNSSDLRIWGVGTSRTLRPHWALAELGLAYETREILPRTPAMQSPDFLRVSRRNKVPILECGDLIIGESGAIVFHLADRYRDRLELSPPPGSDERAVFDDVCLFALMELDAPLYVIRRHAGLPEVYGDSPVAVKAAREYFLRQAEQMEQRLADGRTCLLGDAFSVADILFSTCITWANFIGIEVSDRLAGYQNQVTQRPAHAAAMQKNFPPAAVAAMRDQSGTAS